MAYYKLNNNGDQIQAALDKINNLFNLVYPVGSIYMSVNNTNPSILFGGTWTQIQDRFLLAAGSTYNVETTGGSASSVHSHNYGTQFGAYYGDVSLEGNTNAGLLNYDSNNNITIQSHGDSLGTIAQTYNGGNTGTTVSRTSARYRTIANTSYSSTSTIPPYFTVYVWKRTA